MWADDKTYEQRSLWSRCGAGYCSPAYLSTGQELSRALLTALNAESCFKPKTWQVTGQSKTEDFQLSDPSKLLQVSVKLVSIKLESADSGTEDRPSA